MPPKELIDWKNRGTDDENLSELEVIGRKYKSDLIDKLIAEGVRALGNNFDEDSKRKQVGSWTVEAIVAQTKEYEVLSPFEGGRKIKDGQGRQTSIMPQWIFG